MEPQFQTSFIPKKPLTQEVNSKAPTRVSLLNFISTVFFIGTLVVSGFLYFYISSLNTKIANLKANLEQEKQSFDYETIETMQVLSKRIQGAKEILSNHIAVSPLFSLIENITLKTVQYTKFDYSTEDINGGNIKVSLSGVAPGYKSIGLQEEEFTKSRYIKNPVFKNLTLGDRGQVSFDVEFFVDKSYLNYSNNVTESVSVPVVEQPIIETQEPTPTTIIDEGTVLPITSNPDTPNTTSIPDSSTPTTTNTNTTDTSTSSGSSGSSFFGNPFEQN